MTEQNSDEYDGPYEINHYEDMEYVCRECGESVYFDGMAVKIRMHLREGNWICGRAELQYAHKYWDGDIEPAEVRKYA